MKKFLPILFMALLATSCWHRSSREVYMAVVDVGGGTEEQTARTLETILARLSADGRVLDTTPAGGGPLYEVRFTSSLDSLSLVRLITSTGRFDLAPVYTHGGGFYPVWTDIFPWPQAWDDSMRVSLLERFTLNSNEITYTPPIGYTTTEHIDDVLELLNGPEWRKILPRDVRAVRSLRTFPNDICEVYFVRVATAPDGEAEWTRLITDSFPLDGSYGPEIYVTFNEEGALRFANLTGANIGGQIAMLLDGEVTSAPTVNQRIEGGRATVSGERELEEAKVLSAILRYDMLEVPVTLESLTKGEASARAAE